MRFSCLINRSKIRCPVGAGMVVFVGVLLLSACDIQAQENTDTPKKEAPAQLNIPVSQTTNITQEFKGFYAFKAADDIAVNSDHMETTIVRVLDSLGYAQIAAQDGVESQMHITVLKHGDYILDYQLNNIQDDLAQARNLKIWFENTPKGYAVKHMGVREKCVYGAYQTEWTMGSCPDAPKILPTPKPEPLLTIIPETDASEITILQDGTDAFTGYKRLDVPAKLMTVYPNDGKAISAFIKAFDLRKLANTEGVSAWAKIRTSKAGETTWQYELSYLPDDSVYALDYKIYLEKVGGGTKISRIGHRVKCYRGAKPKQWTVELCP